MSKEKFKNSIFYVFGNGIKIYFSNIDKFILYMLFPVFGQLVGLALTFGLTLGFAQKIADKSTSLSSSILMLCLLAAPGLLIFIKAFWEYMVAYVSLNSMTEGALTTGHVYDIPSHKQVATSRIFKFLGLLFALSLFAMAGSLIFFIVPACILAIYFVLVFQVFTFEPDLRVKDLFKRSFSLIRGNWARTMCLMLILGFFSIYILAQGVSVVFDYLRLTDFLSSSFDFVGGMLPLARLNRILIRLHMTPFFSVELISKTILISIVSSITAGLTLPFRSICWTLWYKTLSEAKKDTEIVLKKSKKVKKEDKEDI